MRRGEHWASVHDRASLPASLTALLESARRPPLCNAGTAKSPNEKLSTPLHGRLDYLSGAMATELL